VSHGVDAVQSHAARLNGGSADLLQVSPKTMSRWAKEGKLPFLKTLGGHRRYPAAEIRQLANELRVEPTT
jgi:excisionase family DNA binding protein